MRANLRKAAIWLSALCVVGMPRVALAEPAGGAPPETVGNWTVVQHTLACEIRDAASVPLGGPTFYRPFRGPLLIFTKANAGVGETPLSPTKNSPGRLWIEGKQLPVEGSLLVEIDVATLTVKGPPTVVVTLVGSEQAFRNALKTASTAQLEFGGRMVGKVPLGGAAEAWTRADLCLQRVGEALLTAKPRFKNGSTPPLDRPIPRSSASKWIDPDSYPPEALRAKAQGDVRVTVRVDRYGYPLDCRVAQSAGFKVLDDATCERILERGRFYPARNKADVAIDGTWDITVQWRI